ETEATIARTFEETGELIDPHTAVAVAAARKETGPEPMVVLSTAHAAKFPDAVRRATGRVPDVPARLAAKLGHEERCTVLANDYAELARFVESHARAGKGADTSARRAPSGAGA